MQAALKEIGTRPRSSKSKVVLRASNLARALLIVVTVAVLFFALRALERRLIRRCEPEEDNLSKTCTNTKRRNTLVHAFGATARVLVIAIGALLALNTVGVHAFTLFTFAGIASLVVGFAAQNTLKDLFSGTLILLEGQVNEEDYVQVAVENATAPLAGVVDDVDLRKIKLRTFDNEIIYIPNGQIQSITNASQTNPILRMQLRLPSTTPLDEAESIVQAVIDQLVADDSFMKFIAPEEAIPANGNDGKEGAKLDASASGIKASKGAGAPNISNSLPSTSPHLIGIMDSDASTYALGIRMMTNVGAQWQAARRLRTDVLGALQKQGIAAAVAQVRMLGEFVAPPLVAA